jgi:hypothetical protein
MNVSEKEHAETIELESLSDLEHLLLSWAQMVAVELIVEDEEAQAAKMELATLLMERFGVTDIKLKQRDMTHYEIGYKQNGEEKSIRFENDEVESIYDL